MIIFNKDFKDLVLIFSVLKCLKPKKNKWKQERNTYEINKNNRLNNLNI